MIKLHLQAHWHKLILVNYLIDPSVLSGYVPKFTILDDHQGKHYISLVGFMFSGTRYNGIPVPFHGAFEEVNLRFYVRHSFQNEIRHGVSFIKEIVPKSAVTFVANHFYQEHYETLPMSHHFEKLSGSQKIEYRWKKKTWHSVQIESLLNPILPAADSKEAFLIDHFWGYTDKNPAVTLEYHVAHERWSVFETLNYTLNVDFKTNYGEAFAFLNDQTPDSVFLAEGSGITLTPSRKLKERIVEP